jgi:large subunit ribosomal protein L20
MKRDFVFAMAKGFRGKAKNCFRIANSQVEEALEHNVRRLSYWFH